GLESKRHRLLAPLLQPGAVSKLAFGRVVRLFSAHALVAQFPFDLLAMKRHLLVQLCTEPRARGQRRKFSQPLKQRVHHTSSACSSTRPIAATIWRNSDTSRPNCFLPAAVSV